MMILNILVAVALLALGRKLFWLFVAGVGFVAALNLAARFLGGRADWLILVVALAAGLVGALLAVFLQKVAIAVAGFLAGGYLTLSLLNILNLEVGRLTWLFYLIGAVIGAIVIFALFDWALIALSSLTGAALLVQTLDLSRLVTILFFIGAFVVGVGIQLTAMRAEQREAPVGQPAE